MVPYFGRPGPPGVRLFGDVGRVCWRVLRWCPTWVSRASGRAVVRGCGACVLEGAAVVPYFGSPGRGGSRFRGMQESVDGVYISERGLRVAVDAVTWIATRSGGPGGQHANTSDTAVTVTIDVAISGLSEVMKTRIMAAAGPTISASSSSSRSQWRNRAGAWTAAFERLDEASKPPPPPRRPTRPKRGAVLDRLDDKRKTSERKQTRRRPSADD